MDCCWRESYNKLMPKMDNDVLINSLYNEGKTRFDESFVRTLKDKIYKKLQLMIINLICLNKVVHE